MCNNKLVVMIAASSPLLLQPPFAKEGILLNAVTIKKSWDNCSYRLLKIETYHVFYKMSWNPKQEWLEEIIFSTGKPSCTVNAECLMTVCVWAIAMTGCCMWFHSSFEKGDMTDSNWVCGKCENISVSCWRSHITMTVCIVLQHVERCILYSLLFCLKNKCLTLFYVIHGRLPILWCNLHVLMLLINFMLILRQSDT